MFRQKVAVAQDEDVKRYFLLCNDKYEKVICDDPVVASRKRIMKNIIAIYIKELIILLRVETI